MSVYKKLQEARIALQAIPLKKSGRNKFAGYEYFELGDFLPTIQEICLHRGLCGSVTFYTDLAILTITDVDKPEDKIEFKCPMSTAALKGCHEVQNLGAVQTYLRRYLWTNAFEIVEHDALDATMGKDEPKKAEPTVESPRIVGKPGWLQIDAPAYIESDAISWLNLIYDSTNTFLQMCNNVDDIMQLFQKNKVLFDKVKEVDPETYVKLTGLLTERKTKLEKEIQDGIKS
jgi:hypothetical protein